MLRLSKHGAGFFNGLLTQPVHPTAWMPGLFERNCPWPRRG
jgi:hypothetical protein